jgi:acetyltransferase-like isoleucine patch superfamily enzyme
MKKIRHLLKISWITMLRLLLRNNSTNIRCYGKIDLSLEKKSSIKNSGDKLAYIGQQIGPRARRNDITQIHLKSQSSLILQNNSMIGSGSTINLEEGATLSIGENTYFSSHTILAASSNITIGKRGMFSWNVNIFDDDGHNYDQQSSCSPITIGDNVWCGCNVTILKGVTIGDNSIIASGAVVTKSFPNNSVIGGVPAKLIREISQQ